MLKKIKTVGLLSGGLLAFPMVAYGQVTDLQSLITLLTDLLDMVVPFLLAIAVVLFMWGVLKYIMSGDDDESRKKATSLMIYGIVAIFVMVGLWGLVGVLDGTFGFGGTTPAQPPELPR